MLSLKNQERWTGEQCALCWGTTYLLFFNSFSISLQWLYLLAIYVCFIPILNWPVFNFLFCLYSFVKRKKKSQMVLALNCSYFVNL